MGAMSHLGPYWPQYLERAFTFSFAAFTFCMFSCLFPTGFSATFSSLAFMFALPVFIRNFRDIRVTLFECAGLLLFGWILLSTLWSDASLSENLKSLSEYRIFWMLPVFTFALANNKQAQQWSVNCLLVGGVIGLLASYGLWAGMLEIEGASLSLANRIYHGFIMSIFFLGCCLLGRENVGSRRILLWFLSFLILFNVVNVENGRTGYLQIIGTMIVVSTVLVPRKRLAVSLLIILIAIVINYLVADGFQTRMDETGRNLVKIFSSEDMDSSGGRRAEFYRVSVEVLLEYPFFGLGVGDVSNYLARLNQEGRLQFYTDNVHSEVFNMGLIGGFPAMLGFFLFVMSVGYCGFAVRRSDRLTGDILIGVSVIILISALFNSTIKDYGEKHAILVVLALLGSRLYERPNELRTKRC